MIQISERYTRICRAYTQLAERFQKLDVEHMALKNKIVPLLQVLKTYRQTVEVLKQEKAQMAEALETMTTQYNELKVLETLLKSDSQSALLEAEGQMDLVAQTLQEIEADSDPDLSDADKALLEEYQHGEMELYLLEAGDRPELMESHSVANDTLRAA